ncbi:hypothetical protein IV102_35200 [bacterium]|nr:hypothetical protein [bacterium]
MIFSLKVMLVLACLSLGWSQGDPVETLVKRLSATHGLWINGLSPTLDMPATASPAEVVDQVFQRVSFTEGRIKKHSIVRVSEVTIGDGAPDRYTAVVVDSDQGQKIVLIQYQKTSGWWSRVFHS